MQDDWNGSAKYIGACYPRAADYGNWCGAPENQWFRATSRMNGYIVAQSLWLRNGCLVDVGTCPNHPTMANVTVVDTWNNAANNKDACLVRAQEYVVWCGEFGLNSATARYFVNGVLLGSKYYRNDF